MNAFETYVYYLAAKKHFTSAYDIVKYNGKVKASVDSFDKRRDKYSFTKLSKHRDPATFIVANLAVDPSAWIGDIAGNEQANARYLAWVKRQESLSYVFKQELGCLDDDFNSNFLVENGQHPKLLTLYNEGKIGVETLLILDSICNFFPYWNAKIDDPVEWPTINTHVQKMKPFVAFDSAKMRKILKDRYV